MNTWNPAARREWLASVRAHVLDLAALARDAAKPKRERTLSREEHLRQIAEVEAALVRELDAADEERPSLALVHGPPSPADEEHPPPSTVRPT